MRPIFFGLAVFAAALALIYQVRRWWTFRRYFRQIRLNILRGEDEKLTSALIVRHDLVRDMCYALADIRSDGERMFKGALLKNKVESLRSTEDWILAQRLLEPYRGEVRLNLFLNPDPTTVSSGFRFPLPSLQAT